LTMARTQAIGRKLVGLALWLGCTNAAWAQLPAGTAPTKPEIHVSPVSANIPAASDKPAALVNGDMISLAEVKALLESRPYPNVLAAEQIKALRQAAIDTLIDDMLVRQFLAKYAPKVTPADMSKEMQRLEAGWKAMKKSRQDVLKDSGQTAAEQEKDIAGRLQWRGYLHSRLSEDQARKYYQDNKPFFDKIEVRASHILVRVPANATPEQKKLLLSKAEWVRQEIVAGKLSFEAAAKQYSDDPVTNKFAVFEAFAKAAFSLKIGGMSELIPSDIGYHLVKVTDRFEPKQLSTYESVRDDIHDIWAHDVELYQQIIAHQRKNGKVEVFLP
jgi:parvulin-like peptidyl-prolyl isomerase